MKLFKETTVWGNTTPNHSYYLSDDKTKMYAYIQASSGKLESFSNPVRFDPRGRKFVELPNTLGYIHESEIKFKSLTVRGSKGNIYTVEEDEQGHLKCSCQGFTFRGTCKHVKELENA